MIQVRQDNARRASSSQYSSGSLLDRSALLPRLTNDETPIPLADQVKDRNAQRPALRRQ